MVEENEQRQQLSPYERGRVVSASVSRRLFDTHEAAIRALHPGADRNKRARLLALSELAETLGPYLKNPELISQARCLRLAAAIRLGLEEAMRTALYESSCQDAEGQWRLLEPYLAEADATPRDAPPRRAGRPKRVFRPRKDLCFRRERTRDGWCFHVTGDMATSDLCDAIFDRIEEVFEPGR